MVGGPIGAIAGAAIGAVAGGLAGKGVAEQIDPTNEDRYWRENYTARPYYDKTIGYEDIGPAYRYGWESRKKYSGRGWKEVEADLGRDWDRTRGKSTLGWEKAKHATRDAWDRLESAFTPEEDKYWSEHYKTRPYYDSNSDYNTYGPAYRYGYEARQRWADKAWEDIEKDMNRDWNKDNPDSELTWDKAKHAVKDAWDKVTGKAK